MEVYDNSGAYASYGEELDIAVIQPPSYTEFDFVGINSYNQPQPAYGDVDINFYQSTSYLPNGHKLIK